MDWVITAIFILLVGITVFSGIKYLRSVKKSIDSKNFAKKRGSLQSKNFGYSMDNEEIYSVSSTDIGV